MEQIFTARNDMEAHFVKGLLEQEEIQVVLQGESLEGAWGDLPVSARSRPSLWVNETDVDRAAPIIAEYQQREQKIASQTSSEESDTTSAAAWKCEKCGEMIELQFDKCWNCGADNPGSGLA